MATSKQEDSWVAEEREKTCVERQREDKRTEEINKVQDISIALTFERENI